MDINIIVCYFQSETACRTSCRNKDKLKVAELYNSMWNLIHTSCSVPILSALNMRSTTANLCLCNHVSYCVVSSHMQPYHVLCIETMSLVKGLLTGSSLDFELHPVCQWLYRLW